MKSKTFKKILSMVCCAAILLSCLSGIFQVSAVDDTVFSSVKSAFSSYVAEKKNNVDPALLDEYINEKLGGAATVNVVDSFIYHSVDGVYDEGDNTYPIEIAGYNGYMSVILEVYQGSEKLGSVGYVETIPFATENLGVLTSDVYSADNANFVTDESGNITGYTGNAEKIVIPATFSGIINLKDCAGKDSVKAVYIGGPSANMESTSIANRSFNNWANLRAMVMPQYIGTINDWAISQNSNLKYIKLPYWVKPVFGKIGPAAFGLNPQLSTAHYGQGPLIPIGGYYGSVFQGTAIRDFYIQQPNNGYKLYYNSTDASNFGSSPSYTEGTQVVLTYAQQQTATLARAAVLAKKAIDDNAADSYTADAVKSVMDAAYSAKNANITSSWSVAFENNYGVLTLTDGTNTIDIEINKNKIDALLEDAIRTAFAEYVSKNGNNVEPEKMVEYVASKIDSKYTIEAADSFIYHSVDGVYDEGDTTYPIEVAGYKGYMSAVLNIKIGEASVGSIGVVEDIAFATENLGVLTSDVYSADNTNFITDESGNITGYTGNAEKIVIPATFSGIINLKDCAGKDSVKAVYIGGPSANMESTSIANRSFNNWANLRAMVMPQYIGTINDWAISQNPNLKYIKLPYWVKPVFGKIGPAAFAYNTQLSTAHYGQGPLIPIGGYWGSVFEGTAIRDYYIQQHNNGYKLQNGSSDASNFGAKPSYTEGTQVVLTYAQQQTATLARAAVLAKKAADDYYSNGCTADALKAEMDKAYSSKNSSITSSWSVPFADDYGVLTLTDGANSIDVVVNYFELDAETEKEIISSIKTAFSEYVSEKGNDVDPELVDDYINKKLSGVATVEVADSFIYHAVDGVYDEGDNTYPIEVAGYKGYMSVVLNIKIGEASVGSVGVVEDIAFATENLGVLTSDVYSADNTNFITDESGNITGYTGNAEKIVIPATFSGVINLKDCAGKDSVKAVYIGGPSANMESTSIANRSFNNWANLRAMVLPQYIGTINDWAISQNPNLKYIKLPYWVKPVFGKIGPAAFAYNTQLSTAHYGQGPLIPIGGYWGSVFEGTAIRDYYIQQHNNGYKLQNGSSDASNFGAKPSYTEGTQVVLTYAQQQTATLARAAVLAKKAADDYYSNGCTADALKAEMDKAYSSKNSEIKSYWTVPFANKCGTLTLSLNNTTIDIDLNYVVKGDVNEDGVADAEDLITLTKHLIGVEEITSDYADVNEDGEVTISDLVRLKKILVGWVEPEPVLSALPNTLKRLEEDNELTIGYLGGSITLGTSSGRTSYSNGTFGDDTGDYSRSWVNQTSAWFSEQYPNAEITTVNAGVSDTQTNMALFRLEETLMNTNGHDMPDLVFVEFTSNDWTVGVHQTSDDCNRQIESLFRNIYTLNPNAEIIVLITSRSASETYYDVMAQYYNIPVIDVGDKLAELMTARGYAAETAGNYYYTVDDLHPSIYGYDVYAEEIQNYLSNELLGLNVLAEYVDYAENLPNAKFDKLIDNPEILLPEELEYTKGTLLDTPFNLNMFGTGTTVSKVSLSDKMLHLTEDSSVTFEIEGNTLGILLQMHSGSDVNFTYTVDGKSTHVVWGQEIPYQYFVGQGSLAFQRYEHPQCYMLEHNLGEGKHTVTLNFTITEGQVVDIGGILYNAETSVG